MSKIWSLDLSESAGIAIYDMRYGGRRAIELENIEDIFKYMDNFSVQYRGYWNYNVIGTDLSDIPRPRLRISDAEFRYDIFGMTFDFVSMRLADMLDLGSDMVQYISVDCSQCPEPARAMGYRVINPLVFADPFDHQRTDGVFNEVALPGGGVTHIWSSNPPGPSVPPPRIQWREDFVPPAPLFRIPGGQWTLVTDDLAEKIMRAGFTDVAFVDVTNDGTRTELVYRQLAD